MKTLSAFVVSSSKHARSIGMLSSSSSMTSLVTMATTPRNTIPEGFGKLFITGATVGPLVDSLHNQCLLEYDRAPIHLFSSSNGNYLLETSWFIPPLLGIAYVVLGGILPRLFQYFSPTTTTSTNSRVPDMEQLNEIGLRNKALLAILSTAMIIKLSEYLQISTFGSEDLNLSLMSITALCQWLILDRTIPALLIGILTAIGGPLSELPFVANGFWHYIPSAANYYPLDTILANNDTLHLALSSITGPCYFAVTMDAIALGRYFSIPSQKE